MLCGMISVLLWLFLKDCKHRKKDWKAVNRRVNSACPWRMGDSVILVSSLGSSLVPIFCNIKKHMLFFKWTEQRIQRSLQNLPLTITLAVNGRLSLASWPSWFVFGPFLASVLPCRTTKSVLAFLCPLWGRTDIKWSFSGQCPPPNPRVPSCLCVANNLGTCSGSGVRQSPESSPSTH